MLVKRCDIAYAALDTWKLVIGLYKDYTTKHCVYSFMKHNVHSDISKAKILSSLGFES